MNKDTNLEDAELYLQHTKHNTAQKSVSIDSTKNLPVEDEVEIPVGDIDYMYDVPLPMVAEIGSTERTLKEVLHMQVGDIVQFEKVIGEPLEVLIGGCMMCRGEIVVVNEHYGIRISEVIRVSNIPQ